MKFKLKIKCFIQTILDSTVILHNISPLWKVIRACFHTSQWNATRTFPYGIPVNSRNEAPQNSIQLLHREKHSSGSLANSVQRQRKPPVDNKNKLWYQEQFLTSEERIRMERIRETLNRYKMINDGLSITHNLCRYPFITLTRVKP